MKTIATAVLVVATVALGAVFPPAVLILVVLWAAGARHRADQRRVRSAVAVRPPRVPVVVPVVSDQAAALEHRFGNLGPA